MEKRNYYINESILGNWNNTTLQRQINTLAFEWVLEHKSDSAQPDTIKNFIKDLYFFNFFGFAFDAKITEFEIETKIITHIQQFLLEFGRGFAFLARQQHIVTDGSDFFIDLVFYNYILNVLWFSI